jgi:hypothetical protein
VSDKLNLDIFWFKDEQPSPRLRLVKKPRRERQPSPIRRSFTGSMAEFVRLVQVERCRYQFTAFTLGCTCGTRNTASVR